MVKYPLIFGVWLLITLLSPALGIALLLAVALIFIVLFALSILGRGFFPWAYPRSVVGLEFSEALEASQSVPGGFQVTRQCQCGATAEWVNSAGVWYCFREGRVVDFPDQDIQE